MASVRCADGRRLHLEPVAVLDRTGEPYEVVLRLRLDGAPVGDVGQRCGHALATLAALLRAAGPDQLPPCLAERGVRTAAREVGEDADAAWARASRHLPHDQELLCLRRRDPDDPAGAAELRVSGREVRRFTDRVWQVERVVVLEAWDEGGAGVRARLSVAELQALLDALLEECAAVGVPYVLPATVR
jgi:hypothetical protein